MTTGTEPTPQGPVRTDEELAAKLRGQLQAAAATLTEIGRREYNVDVSLHSNDVGTWLVRLAMSKTVYL